MDHTSSIINIHWVTMVSFIIKAEASIVNSHDVKITRGFFGVKGSEIR